MRTAIARMGGLLSSWEESVEGRCSDSSEPLGQVGNALCFWGVTAVVVL